MLGFRKLYPQILAFKQKEASTVLDEQNIKYYLQVRINACWKLAHKVPINNFQKILGVRAMSVHRYWMEKLAKRNLSEQQYTVFQNVQRYYAGHIIVVGRRQLRHLQLNSSSNAKNSLYLVLIPPFLDCYRQPHSHFQSSPSLFPWVTCRTDKMTNETLLHTLYLLYAWPYSTKAVGNIFNLPDFCVVFLLVSLCESFWRTTKLCECYRFATNFTKNGSCWNIMTGARKNTSEKPFNDESKPLWIWLSNEITFNYVRSWIYISGKF